MIYSENPEPSLKDFTCLMERTDKFLNDEAKTHESYYSNRNDQKLEEDVCRALTESAKGTVFENSIHLVSGAKFPDIVAHDFYGVEVKSTISNHWTSTGSSILESTRIPSVERIFMTFGKLGSPIEFRSKPYEECLSEIAVTHYPRYRIDMNLRKGETIFDKMGIPYDELRKMDNPVVPVSKYYKSKLKPGESLWWASESNDTTEETVPFIVKLFSVLDREEKDNLRVLLTVFFPSILGNGQSKYDNPSLWLLTHKGIISTHIRDEFSAGGKVDLPTKAGILVKMPAVFGRIEKHRDLIEETLRLSSTEALSENWGVLVDNKNRIGQWIDLCSSSYSCGDSAEYEKTKTVLNRIFSVYESNDVFNLNVADSHSSSDK